MDNFQNKASLGFILSLNGGLWNVSEATRDIIKYESKLSKKKN